MQTLRPYQTFNSDNNNSTRYSRIKKNIDETKLNKPLILCQVDGRNCTLEYKQKPTSSGLIWVKYEDGETLEVTAEQVQLNSIIEA